MRVSRLTGVLAGFLIALLASGSLRLAHLTMAHAPGAAVCEAACTHGPAGQPSAPHHIPNTPATPGSSDCATCALLAVLLPDGLPVAAAPFFPVCAGTVVTDAPESAPTVRCIGVALARGPPSITPFS